MAGETVRTCPLCGKASTLGAEAASVHDMTLYLDETVFARARDDGTWSEHFTCREHQADRR